MNQTIGFIGGGNMATSLIGGLIKQDPQAASKISVYQPTTKKAQDLAQRFGIRVAPNNTSLVEESDIVVMSVKPQVMQDVLTPEQAAFANKKPLIISIAAGITIASIEGWLQGEFSVVRVMPNTPALVGAGASGMYANSRVSKAQQKITSQLMNAVGTCAWVESENDIDSITALSGSGPAYFMLFIQALIEAGESAGLKPETAKAMAVQTAAGAAQLIASSDDSVDSLIRNVTSPNGTTQSALESLDQNNFKHIIQQAFEAARNRSQELAKELA